MEMEDVKLPVKLLLPNGVPLYLINEGVRDVVRLDLLLFECECLREICTNSLRFK